MSLCLGVLFLGPASAANLQDLANVDELRMRFNADAGVPRIVLLLSPT